jgi:hypothetical protein
MKNTNNLQAFSDHLISTAYKIKSWQQPGEWWRTQSQFWQLRQVWEVSVDTFESPIGDKEAYAKLFDNMKDTILDIIS